MSAQPKIVWWHNRYWFHCPGCKIDHVFDLTWGFNGDIYCPSVAPSILVNRTDPMTRCHFHLVLGQFHFLDDCHHALFGKIVDMLDFDNQHRKDPAP